MPPIHIAADHPAFAGHFPDAPVLPGALLLSMVIRSAAEATGLHAATRWQVDQVKFLGTVAPDSHLQLTLADDSRGLKFELAQGARTVARGRLSPLSDTGADAG